VTARQSHAAENISANEAAAEILRVYRARGMSGTNLRAAVGRHANVMRSLDPEVADALECLPLREGKLPPSIAESEWGS
jgi:hypothetical protein